MYISEARFYTVERAARDFKVPVELILRLCKEGTIKAIYLNPTDYRIFSDEMYNIENSGLFRNYKNEDEDEDEES